MKRGRKTNPHKLPYGQAKAVVQLEGLRSRKDYFVWWDMYEPIEIPRRPNRAYGTDWNGWTDFLGTSNSFTNKVKKKFRQFDDAFVYAQSTNISTSTEWMEYDKHPDDIPHRPDIVYRGKFKGWRHFLQTGVRKAQAVQDMVKRVEETQVLLFALPHGNPANQIHISIHPNVEMAKQFMGKTHYQFIKAFKLEPGYDWKSVVGQYATDYGSGEWLVSNLDQLLFDIDLEWVR